MPNPECSIDVIYNTEKEPIGIRFQPQHFSQDALKEILQIQLNSQNDVRIFTETPGYPMGIPNSTIEKIRENPEMQQPFLDETTNIMYDANEVIIYSVQKKQSTEH